MTDELLKDLIKTNLFNVLQWVNIRPTEYSPLTPFETEIAKLAAKYEVPSPFDRGDPIHAAPPIPEGKTRNA